MPITTSQRAAMGIKHGAPTLLACATACVDVEPRTPARKPVLGSIENVLCNQNAPTTIPVLSPNAKKQRCIEQAAPAPLEAGPLFTRARALLRQPPSSAVSAPIGREQQAQLLQGAIDGFTASGAGQSIYVSGLPGTGKSHTVRKLLQQLLSRQPGAAAVTWVNCMSVSSAADVYAQIAASAPGQGSFEPAQPPSSRKRSRRTADQASDNDDEAGSSGNSGFPCTATSSSSNSSRRAPLTYQQLVGLLSQDATAGSAAASRRPAAKSYRAASAAGGQQQHKRGRQTTTPAAASSSAGGSRKHIIVLDEIDNLIKRSQAELVQLFLLPHQPGVSVLLVGIANSIDLTERMLPELKLRMVSPALVTFPAYSTKQLAAILAACVEELPGKVFEPAALELCARSVASSSGDLRHALKACRAAVDELERQLQQRQQQQEQPAQEDAGVQPQAAAAASPAVPTVTLKVMMGALARLAGVRSSQFGAQAASSIRALPNQQQLLLYALSVLCRPREDAAASGGSNHDSPGANGSTSSLWKRAGTAVALSSSAPGSGSKKGAARSRIDGSGGSVSGSQVFVLAVGLDEAFAQYRQVCKLLALPACSRCELQHMAELLSQAALVDIISCPAPAGTGSGGCGAGGGASAGWGGSSAAGRGLAGVRAKGGLGGLSRSLLGGGGGSMRSGAGAAVSGRQQQQSQVKLSLRASVDEVAAALRHNPALRCLVDK